MIHSLTLKNACISTSSRTKSCSTQQGSKNYVIMVIMLAMANVQHGNQPLDPHKIVRYVRHQLDCRKECKENDRIDRRTETGVMVTCQYKEKSA